VSIQHPYGLLPAAFVSRKATHFAQSVQTVSLSYGIGSVHNVKRNSLEIPPLAQLLNYLCFAPDTQIKYISTSYVTQQKCLLYLR